MLKKIWKGFSWIEIASALLLFAVVVVLTLPSYSKFKCLGRQSEAKFELLRILAAAELYKAEHAKYPSFGELLSSGRVKLRREHYNYEIKVSDDGTKIWVTAIGKPGSKVATDKWQIDTTRTLENLVDVCSVK